VQIRILGPIDIVPGPGETALQPAGAMQRALLAILVVRMGRSLPPDRLADKLWGGHPPAKAANALQAHLTRLRRLLASAESAQRPRIITSPTGYVLHAGPEATDAARFRRLSAEGRARVATDPAGAATTLSQALGLWRGAAFQDCDEEDCRVEAIDLEESRLIAVEAYHDACLRAGRHEEIVGELETLTRSHPERERMHDHLMVALYRCGRPTEALGAYERARSRLAAEFGVDPGPALRARVEEILRHSPDLGTPTPARPVVATLPLARATDDPAAGELNPGVLAELDGELAHLRRSLDVLSSRYHELTRRMNQLTALAQAR
jgi:DNA-binding SARP family transcriptional activator